MLPLLLERITQANVLVIGDAMLDRYWYGEVERISPEAPVPVATVKRADERPGGAANVACNVLALGARCTLLAITGDDREADSLRVLTNQAGIVTRLQRDKLINTTVKLRVISRNQQLMRIDFEAPASKDAQVRLLEDYLANLAGADVVVISDYGKGALGNVPELIGAARAAGLPVIVDPKGDDYTQYRGATLLKPNRKEFEHVAGRLRDQQDLEQKAAATVAALDLDGLLITRGEEGMSLIARSGEVVHMPARAREVFDVTGAGDTVTACIGCAYAADAGPQNALQLANIAAGIVVGKLGAATATAQEILHALAVQEV